MFRAKPAAALAVALFVVGAAIVATPPPVPLEQAAVSHTREDPPAIGGRPLPPADDLLFDQRFEGSGAGGKHSFESSFTVEREYNFLEIRLGADGLMGAGWTYEVRILDPEGNVVADLEYDIGPFPWYGLPSMGVTSDTSPAASVLVPLQGSYAVELEVSGGMTAIVAVRGVAGKAADFTIDDVLGKGTFRLSEQAGKVVLVELMSTWCSICQRMAPKLQTMYESYDRARFELVGVDTDVKDTKEGLRHFMESHGATSYAGMDDGTVIKAYAGGQTGWPRWAVVDPAGNWIYANAGEVPIEELRAAIDAALDGR
ncbi:MAG TPA: TlpA disulfide reductase family protein [Candidatus Thermoplasmatota archaeon]|nr:TlpA disulfide reductase family protein [Candidatus Thermoplasmatota archaeon]